MTSEFDLEPSRALGLTRSGEVSEEKMCANITHFVKEVMPVADKFGVRMTLHPDDLNLSHHKGSGISWAQCFYSGS